MMITNQNYGGAPMEKAVFFFLGLSVLLFFVALCVFAGFANKKTEKVGCCVAIAIIVVPLVLAFFYLFWSSIGPQILIYDSGEGSSFYRDHLSRIVSKKQRIWRWNLPEEYEGIPYSRQEKMLPRVQLVDRSFNNCSARIGISFGGDIESTVLLYDRGGPEEALATILGIVCHFLQQEEALMPEDARQKARLMSLISSKLDPQLKIEVIYLDIRRS